MIDLEGKVMDFISATNEGVEYNAFDESNPLISCEKASADRTLLYHYTNLDSLLLILKNKQLLLNRLDRLNDLREKNYLTNNARDENDLCHLYTLFVASFSHTDNPNDSESIPQWHMYTNGKYGVRIGFKVEKNEKPIYQTIYDKDRTIVGVNECGNRTDVSRLAQPAYSKTAWVASIKQTDIYYDSKEGGEFQIYIEHDGKQLINTSVAAAIKHPAWSYENETRIIARLSAKEEISDTNILNYLLVPIRFNYLKELEIMFSPWMSEELQDSVKCACAKYIPDIIPNFRKSMFEGVITRN